MRFTTQNNCFGYRVAAVILHKEHILLQGEPTATIWTLPGGGVELLETAQYALKREVREELGVDVQIERPLWMVEQFFLAHDGTTNHELGLYFLASLLHAPHLYELDRLIQSKDGQNGEVAILFRWFKISELMNIALYPTFLPSALQKLPSTPEFITWVEDEAVLFDDQQYNSLP